MNDEMLFVESHLFVILIIKYCAEFSLIYLSTTKCVIKRREMCSFLSIMNNSVTTGLSLSAIISNTINIFVFYLNCILRYFFKYQCHLSIQ